MKKKHIIIGVAVLLLVPIAVNIICLSTVPFPTIGDGETWLAFFGSFLGGVVTALITLYVLYRTIESGKYKKEFEIQQEFFSQFCKDLAELSTVLNLEFFLYVLMQLMTLNENEVKKAASSALDYGNRIKTLYNSFFLKYGHLPSEAKKEYVREYNDITTFVSDQIDKITDFAGKIISLREEDRIIDYSMKESLRKEVSVLCDEFRKKSEENTQDIFPIANRWKKEEWDKLVEIENKYLNS